MKNNPVFIMVLFSLLVSCGENKEEKSKKVPEPEVYVSVPDFNADSAYYFIQKQLAFGPRVPNTLPHKKTGDYLVEKLRSYGAEVQVQEFQATTFDNQLLKLRNIIASFYPEKTKRILLAAHWDTRPFADKDSIKQEDPIPGANDGASGVGVLLEIARVLSQNNLSGVGVDIIFFDGEDWGEKRNERVPPLPADLESWWCLGSQYWSKNKHERGYFAYYGILLDMVGAKNSQFHVEGLSEQMAPKIVDKVWETGRELGYGQYFVRKVQPPITDDHEFVNKFAKIPMINIVHYDPEEGYFGNYHHSHRDNLDLIDKNTLEAVGETVLHVLYYEQSSV